MESTYCQISQNTYIFIYPANKQTDNRQTAVNIVPVPAKSYGGWDKTKIR